MFLYFIFVVLKRSFYLFHALLHPFVESNLCQQKLFCGKAQFSITGK